MEVIDLVTPPSSPGLGKENARPFGKRKVSDECIVLDSDDEDDNVAEVAAPPKLRAATIDGTGAVDDDDLEFVGRTGYNALEDFPHSREHCVAVSFTMATAQQHCSNCFCFVCDEPSAACQQWSQHCTATHVSAHWKALRKQKQEQRLGLAPSPPAAAPAHNFFAPPNRVAPQPAAPAAGEAWSCERVLREVQQVWPEQASEPAGLLASVRLRSYQKQALSFMNEMEKTEDLSLIGIRHYGGGAAVSRHCSDESGPPVRVRGGWLASEMGMGKTMVCISLMLANRYTDKDARAVTIVLTPCSLLGQWKDEITKFARAPRHHSPLTQPSPPTKPQPRKRTLCCCTTLTRTSC